MTWSQMGRVRCLGTCSTRSYHVVWTDIVHVVPHTVLFTRNSTILLKNKVLPWVSEAWNVVTSSNVPKAFTGNINIFKNIWTYYLFFWCCVPNHNTRNILEHCALFFWMIRSWKPHILHVKHSIYLKHALIREIILFKSSDYFSGCILKCSANFRRFSLSSLKNTLRLYSMYWYKKRQFQNNTVYRWPP